MLWAQVLTDDKVKHILEIKNELFVVRRADKEAQGEDDTLVEGGETGGISKKSTVLVGRSR